MRAMGVVRTLCAEELARDVEGLGADDDDLLAVQKLLGHDGRQATEEVALSVNNDRGCREGGHGGLKGVVPVRIAIQDELGQTYN